MILVTGATGRIGNHVVRTLRKMKKEVRALVRKGSEYFWLHDCKPNFFFSDLSDVGSLARSMVGCEYLIVCSGVRKETRHNNHQNVTIEGHRQLFELAKEKGFKRVILISCVGVDSGYPISAFQARKETEELLIHSGLDYTILRVPVSEHFFLDLAWQVKDGRPGLLAGGGENKLSPLPARDVARMAVLSMHLPQAKNRIFELGGGEQMSARQGFEMACAVVGVSSKATCPPASLVELGKNIGRPFRRYANLLAENEIWTSEDFPLNTETQKLFGLEMTPLREAMVVEHDLRLILSDTDLRMKKMVHPKFMATIYKPGEQDLSELATGPLLFDTAKEL